MTNINLPEVKRSGIGFSRNRRTVLLIDMTPMVDLGFLLITFFVFTTTISTPSATTLYMPKDTGINNPQKLPDGLALTFLLAGEKKIFYYNGIWEDAVKTNSVFETNYSYMKGLGEVIRQKQKAIDASGKFQEGKKGLMLLIKPAKNSTYQEIIDALDEVLINDVKKYAIVEPGKPEITWMNKKNSSNQQPVTSNQ